MRIEAHFVEIVAGGKRGEKKGEDGDTEEKEEGVESAAEKVAHQAFTIAGAADLGVRRGAAARRARVASCCGARRTC